MSAAESAQQAARLSDPVGHGLGMIGMIAGAIAGAVVGALLIAGGVVTGGALIAVVVAGCVAGGGLAGGQLLRGIQRAMALPNPTTGVLGPGSPNVFIGRLPAARVFDTAVACNGLYSVNHFPLPLVPIAEGSATVRINGLLAARVTSKLVCGAPIIRGKDTVQIGGPTQQVLPIHDNEALLEKGLAMLGLAALAGGAVLAAAAGAAAFLGFAAWTAGGMLAFKGLGWVGDQIGPGWSDILQGAAGLVLLGAAGVKGYRGIQKGAVLSPRVEQKILYGERVANPNSPGGMSNEIIGGHSPRIKSDPSYDHEVISHNPDGTTTVKYTKQFPDGQLARIKKSTLAPDNWSDQKILDTTNQVANSPSVATRARDGATLHRETIDGVQWEVIKDSSGNVTSSYPTGGNPSISF